VTKDKAMNIEPTEEARKTIERWLQTHLLEELGSWDLLPQVVADFPENTGRVNPTALKSVKSIDLGSMRLKSLSQSVVNATFSATLSLSLYVSKEDYEASQEVRDFVGNHEDYFLGIYTDTDSTLDVCLDFELLHQPPMVISTRFRSISGPTSNYVFK
jgi:hypothetical protein